MNRAQVRRLAIVSGLLASTGITLVFGGGVAVILGAVSASVLWVVIGAIGVVVGAAAYFTARRIVRRFTAPSDQ